MRRIGTLPLMDQPGEQWRYNTGSQILGVLVARASGQSVDSFYRELIFEPLGMKDTTFQVPARDLQRLVPCYQQVGGRLESFDDDNAWTRPRAFTDCGAGLVATAGDYLAFGQMLLAGGVRNGTRFLASELVAEMTADQLSAAQRDTAGPILGGRGWGFGLSIIDRPEPRAPDLKGYGWSGGFGTVWANDPDADLVAIMCTQVLAAPSESLLERDFWSATYDALER
jgi:CubicO group peptidase (beta-lactamase class C family)